MTTDDSTANLSDSAIFEPFQWHMEETENANLPGGAVMRLATAAHDISRGAQTILQILERDGLAELSEGEERKLFNDNDRGHLLRMAISSLSMLGDESESIIEWAYKYHTPEGRREREAQTA